MSSCLELPNSKLFTIKRVNYKIIFNCKAKGGPRDEVMGEDHHPRGRTPEGKYRVQKSKKHTSISRYAWSKIEWDTQIRKANRFEYEALVDGKWQSCTRITGVHKFEIIEKYKRLTGKNEVPKTWPFKEDYWPWNEIPVNSPIRENAGELEAYFSAEWKSIVLLTGLNAEDIEGKYKELYNEDIGKNPTWVFNDFGRFTIYLYKDSNHNQKFDPRSEKVIGQMFHTTPENEAEISNGATHANLVESHGCIHVDPLPFQDMIDSGYFANNNEVFIYDYDEDLPDCEINKTEKGKPPYVVHFFPKPGIILVTGK